MQNFMKIKKTIKEIHQILTSCDILVHSCMTGDLEPNALGMSAGEASFLAFEAIMLLAGFHLKFMAIKSLYFDPQQLKSFKSPRNVVR